ncbi:hypothetical protein MY4824_008793 [Beauveria thailandica]
MSSIGPQLPSQPSAKRKRKHTPEPGDNHTASSSSKHARRNADEINLDDDASSESDSNDYGPRAPAAASIDSKPSLGPSLPPPTPSTRNQDEIDLDDSASSSSSSSHTGPAPPPPPPSHTTASTAQPMPADSDSDSGSDSDDYGPALPSASNTRRGPIGPTLPPTTDPSAPSRDEWMLAPPVHTGYTERDPTKLKARKFTSSKPGRGGGGPSSSADSSGLAAIWTETPQEKLKRLQDAVLGRSDASGQSAEAAAAAAARTRDEDARNTKVAAAIAAHRGRSLYDEHQAGKNGGGGGGSEGGGGGKNKKTGKGGEQEDDPSKRAFDREKDMALGSKIGTAQRRELVAKSANFGGRFQKGSFL